MEHQKTRNEPTGHNDRYPRKICLVATDFPELELYCPNWRGMKAGLERLNIPYDFISCRPTLDVSKVTASQADLIVYCLKDLAVRADWRKQIKEQNSQAKIVFWYGDLRNEQTGFLREKLTYVDFMFVSNDGQKEFYEKYWHVTPHFLPLGCEPLPEPVYNARFALDFVFIGGQITSGAFWHRSSLVQRFVDETNLKVINSFEPGLRAKIFQKMPEIYSSSKVCLDISHFTDILGYTSIRYWEIPAFWGLALTKRFPGCEEFYPDGRVYFDTFEEAVEMKDYYLAHEAERGEIVALGHKRSYEHTYEQRFKKMFDIINK